MHKQCPIRRKKVTRVFNYKREDIAANTASQHKWIAGHSHCNILVVQGHVRLVRGITGVLKLDNNNLQLYTCYQLCYSYYQIATVNVIVLFQFEVQVMKRFGALAVMATLSARTSLQTPPINSEVFACNKISSFNYNVHIKNHSKICAMCPLNLLKSIRGTYKAPNQKQKQLKLGK